MFFNYEKGNGIIDLMTGLWRGIIKEREPLLASEASREIQEYELGLLFSGYGSSD